MSRDGVNQVDKPDKEEIHEQDLRGSSGPRDVDSHGSHTPERLQVECAKKECRPHVYGP